MNRRGGKDERRTLLVRSYQRERGRKLGIERQCSTHNDIAMLTRPLAVDHKADDVDSNNACYRSEL